MSERAVAISLKIPDNAAFTAQSALRRLGIEVAHLERSEIWRFDDGGDILTLAARVERNETIFNPNKHRIAVLDTVEPRAGEVWIEELGALHNGREYLGGKAIADVTDARRCVGWRLTRENGEPESDGVVRRAAEDLLCNSAIEHALFRK